MVVEIEEYSFDEAFEIFKEKKKVDFEKFLIIERSLHLEELSRYEGMGFCFAYMMHRPEGNKNKIKTSVLDTPTKGKKDWLTKYLIVDANNRVLTNKNYDTKKDAVDAARLYTKENFLNSYVIIGKSASNFSRVQAEINYKPSGNTIPGEFIFVY